MLIRDPEIIRVHLDPAKREGGGDDEDGRPDVRGPLDRLVAPLARFSERTLASCV